MFTISWDFDLFQEGTECVVDIVIVASVITTTDAIGEYFGHEVGNII